MKVSTYKYILFWSLSALLMVIGIAVMTGWFLQNSLLVQLRSDFAPMQFNTALCFALCSCLLIANIKAQELISAFCSALVVAISGLTLLEYSANINLGIDELFIDHYLQTKTSHPGVLGILPPNIAIRPASHGWRDL